MPSCRSMLRKALPCTALLALALALTSAPALAHVERAVVLARPGARLLGQAVRRRRGAEGALARVGARTASAAGRHARRLPARLAEAAQARRSRSARKHGYDIRPTDHRTLQRKQAQDAAARSTSKLFKRCRFHEIQPAVTASRNNDRVVVMPGLYTEPTARAQPTHDPACEQYQTHSRHAATPARSRTPTRSTAPTTRTCRGDRPRRRARARTPTRRCEDRHGIPNLGPCIRCNLQIEGSGVSADDVVIEAGDAAGRQRRPVGGRPREGRRHPRRPRRRLRAAQRHRAPRRASTTSTSSSPTATCSTASRPSTPAATAC